MALTAGDKLGLYQIPALIGKGGMGEVYSAHDPRTGREVAVKVAAERFSERIDREIRVIAALNHANICTLYDVGPNYLVMELVEGKTLAERIKRGPIPLDAAVRIARQIADALEAAHEKGIVHRDLKPGNIKIKPDDTVKVLDFGLAKLPPGAISDGDPEEAPTLTMATQAGVILGTAAYGQPLTGGFRPDLSPTESGRCFLLRSTLWTSHGTRTGSGPLTMRHAFYDWPAFRPECCNTRNARQFLDAILRSAFRNPPQNMR